MSCSTVVTFSFYLWVVLTTLSSGAKWVVLMTLSSGAKVQAVSRLSVTAEARVQSQDSPRVSGVPRNFVWGGEQIQLRKEDRDNGYVRAVAP